MPPPPPPGPGLAADIFTDGVEISDTDIDVADLFVADQTVLDGQTCIGDGCDIKEDFATDITLRLNGPTPSIDFVDSSNTTLPDRDWRLLVNDSGSGGLERFSIEDLTAGSIPFTVEGGAPDAALHLAASGNLGLGTSLPAADLHIVSPSTAALRLERDGSGGSTAQTWELRGSYPTLGIYNPTNGFTPVQIYNNAPNSTLMVGAYGVGVGSLPTAGTALLVTRSNGNAQIKVQEFSPTTSPRTLLNLQNNGRPEIVMGNTDTGGEWSFGAGTNFILKQGAVGSASNAKTKLFEIDDAGNATLTGSLTTGGPSCASGCDAVLAEGYALPSIAEHAAAMKRLGHLPNVGPTLPGAPLDLSERYGTLLNELEHAHLYIAQQQAELTAQRGELAALKTVVQALVADRN
ncbi:MAG: hypothetical protein R3D85_15030 [Paracoccaceae bacterium]